MARQTLNGLKEICDYTGMGENLILRLIRHSRFPARKTETEGGGGVWISNTEAIDKWSYGFANSGIPVNVKDPI